MAQTGQEIETCRWSAGTSLPVILDFGRLSKIPVPGDPSMHVFVLFTSMQEIRKHFIERHLFQAAMRGLWFVVIGSASSISKVVPRIESCLHLSSLESHMDWTSRHTFLRGNTPYVGVGLLAHYLRSFAMACVNAGVLVELQHRRFINESLLHIGNGSKPRSFTKKEAVTPRYGNLIYAT